MRILEVSRQALLERLKAAHSSAAGNASSSAIGPEAVESAEDALERARFQSKDGLAIVHEQELDPDVNEVIKQFFLDTRAVQKMAQEMGVSSIHYNQRPPLPAPPSSPPRQWLQHLFNKQMDESIVRSACSGLPHALHTFQLPQPEREVVVQRLVSTLKLGSSFVSIARAWVGEMERFLLLKALCGDTEAEILSPSGHVDAAWHECILETDIYQQHCQRLLGTPNGFIQHNPDGAMDKDRAHRYRKTCYMYQEVFGERAPDLAWERPPAEDA